MSLYGYVCLCRSQPERCVTVRLCLSVQVTAGEGKSVYFPIVPSSLGNVELVVSAQSTQAADAVRRQLLVEVKYPSAVRLHAANECVLFWLT